MPPWVTLPRPIVDPLSLRHRSERDQLERTLRLGRRTSVIPRAMQRTTPLALSASATSRGHKTDTSETDTRDVSRRISIACNSAFCRRKCVASDRACTRVTPRNLHGKEGVDGSSPSEGSKIPAKRGFLLSDLVQPSTSFARRGSRVNRGSTPQRVAGNQRRFLGAPAALRSGGQVLGTNDGWLGPNGSSARALGA